MIMATIKGCCSRRTQTLQMNLMIFLLKGLLMSHLMFVARHESLFESDYRAFRGYYMWLNYPTSPTEYFKGVSLSFQQKGSNNFTGSCTVVGVSIYKIHSWRKWENQAGDLGLWLRKMHS